jgi:hypothetical protein
MQRVGHLVARDFSLGLGGLFVRAHVVDGAIGSVFIGAVKLVASAERQMIVAVEVLVAWTLDDGA